MDASPVFRNAGISYLHIPATDPQQSARFYEACFGWKIGGTVERETYPEGDLLVATFRDPAGNVVGSWQRSTP